MSENKHGAFAICDVRQLMESSTFLNEKVQ